MRVREREPITVQATEQARRPVGRSVTMPRSAAARVPERPLFGGIEAGGTKFVCVIGTAPDDIAIEMRLNTADPASTLDGAARFFRSYLEGTGLLLGLGIASFGPLELRLEHPRYGFITTTPKPGWSDTDVVGPIREALRIPVGIDTDVNAAALAEGRWGAAQGLRTYVYVTVGTGIGGGAVVGGRIAHGLVHSEMGHMSVPRQDGDDYPGSCPFHGDCLEGMASGRAIADRFGCRAEELVGPELHRAVELEASYLAAGLRNIVYAIAPERIVLGGGVASLPGLLPALRSTLISDLAGYPALPEHEADDFVAAAVLDDKAGAAGALMLAKLAAERTG